MILKKLLIKHKDRISEISALAASISAGDNDIKRVAGSVVRYHAIYTELLKMRPKKSKYHIRVAERTDDFDKQKYIGVDGYKTNPKKQAYALEFTPWKEWLGMDMANLIQDEKKGLAYCLWEMTFMGFDQGAIRKKLKKLDRSVKEVFKKKQGD